MEWEEKENFEKNEWSWRYRTAEWLQPSRSAVWSRQQPARVYGIMPVKRKVIA